MSIIISSNSFWIDMLLGSVVVWISIPWYNGNDFNDCHNLYKCINLHSILSNSLLNVFVPDLIGWNT